MTPLRSMRRTLAGLIVLAALDAAAPAVGEETPLSIAVLPARPTLTDDLVVRTRFHPLGCRFLTSDLSDYANEVEGWVVVTSAPYGCPSDDPTFVDILTPLPLSGGAGSYRLSMWLVRGAFIGPVADDPSTHVTADVVIGDAEWLIPAVARASGVGGSRWTTDLEILNTDDLVEASVTLAFLASGGSGAGAPRTTVVVPANGSVRIADVLGSRFGIESGSGALVVTNRTTRVRLVASVANASITGRITQSIPAVPGRGKLRSGASRDLAGIREDDAERTNLVLANAGAEPATVSLDLYTGGREPERRMDVTVPARGTTQVNRVVRAMGVGRPLAGARLTITAVDAADGIAAIATVIDNATNSPRTLVPE